MNPSVWDLQALAGRYRAARPFPHLVLDDVVAPETVAVLLDAVAHEPHWPNLGEIYSFMASADTVAHPKLREFHETLSSPAMLLAIQTITGHLVARCDLRSYVYLAGSYLLPHADSRTSLRRMIAYVYYLHISCEGGELELFDCQMEGDEVALAKPSTLIQPKDNRLVLFDVTNASLHQVREVLSGARVSLTGWYLG